MRILKQICWLTFFSLLGVGIAAFLPFPIPGSVVGMILLFFALHYKLLKIEDVDTVGNWLIHNMALFFVPAGVGLMNNFGLLQSIWWQLILILVISTIAMILIIGKAVQLMRNSKEGNEGNGQSDSQSIIWDSSHSQ